LIVDIFQATFADLSPLEAYDFADSRNNLSGEPLLFTQPNFVCGKLDFLKSSNLSFFFS
jgi:hypothetical protein